MLHLGHAHCLFGQIVGKRHVGLCHEAPNIVAVIAQSANQIGGLALLGSAAFASRQRRQFENYLGLYTNFVPGRRTLLDLVKLGKAPKIFGESRDPERLVPLVFRAEDIMIAVSGDPLRTNCYVFCHNGYIGSPTARAVILPKDWRAKLKASG